MLSKLSKTRLEKLIKYMESRPKSAAKHFSMKSWFNHDSDHDIKVGTVITAKHLHACGTSACAMGYAATMPYFRKLGLSVKQGAWGAYLHFNGNEDRTFDQVQQLFDITFDQACDLFGADKADRSPQSWAKRARRLVKKWESEVACAV